MTSAAPPTGSAASPPSNPLRPMRIEAYRYALGLIPGLEFFENALLVYFAVYVAGGVDASPKEFVWMTTAYGIASVLAILKQQWFVERIGYRRYLTASLLLYACGAILAGTSESVTQLVIARACQGFCAGSWMSSCRILAQVSMPTEHRGKTVQTFALLLFTGSAAAPLVGGLLVSDYTWRTLFLCTAPPAVLLAGLTWLSVPDVGRLRDRVTGGNYPFAPFMAFALAMGAFQVVLQEMRYSQWLQTPWLPLLTVAGVGALVWFGYHQWQHPEPLIRLQSLRRREFQVGLVLYVAYYYLANTQSYLMPHMLEQGLGFTVERTGQLLGDSALLTVFLLLAYFHVAKFITHKKLLIVSGFAMTIATNLWLGAMPPDAGQSQLYGVLALKAVFGIFTVLPVANLTFRTFDHESFAHGYRLKNILRQLSGSFAVSTIVAFDQHREALHRTRLTEMANPFNPVFTQTLDSLANAFTHAGVAASQAHGAALAQIAQMIQRQASFLSLIDDFHFVAIVALCGAIFAAIQKRLN
ncbi:major facilitator transporter [Pandoraea communis]|uniref:Major facilitator transporter n=1 Tax=Pandoraea communis TaxID=2508297 RepID=A0A5E4TXV6_9BURK|nr:MFS transporter [Pandoraea communis]VVD92725.1 major facilitator transporter [Pandoraea communis]